MNAPTFYRVRVRASKHAGRTITLDDNYPDLTLAPKASHTEAREPKPGRRALQTCCFAANSRTGSTHLDPEEVGILQGKSRPVKVIIFASSSGEAACNRVRKAATVLVSGSPNYGVRSQGVVLFEV